MGKAWGDKLCRRTFLGISGGLAASVSHLKSAEREGEKFTLRYMLASSMYGKTDVLKCIEQVKKIGASCIDLWPPSHGDQRVQIDRLGHGRFMEALNDAGVSFELSTRYDLGPYRLQKEMAVVNKLGGKMIVCASRKQTETSLKDQVTDFLQSMRSHVARAKSLGITIAIENHSNALISSPDSIKYFSDLNRSENLGLALAPYHLPQDENMIADLIRHCGRNIVHFYAWEHGLGCHRPMPKQYERMQLPGLGTLDFAPIVGALRAIDYRGFTEIFMHPTPRGIPILSTTAAVNDVINLSREYLERSISRNLNER